MQINLAQNVILVTGASRGIGKAIVEMLAQTNATIALHYAKNEHLAQKVIDQLAPINANIHLFQADLSQFNACHSLMLAVLEKFGRLDGLVNNAGVAIASPIDKNLEKWTQDWDYTMTVNLRATAVISRLTIEQFRKQTTGGRIVHIASRAAFRGDTAEYLAYAASKAGMVALSHSIARAYGKENIKSFVIAPGFTRTDMAQEFIDQYGEQYATQDLALNAITEPQNIAPMVVFLLSGMADHATGTSIDINAGSYVH